MGLPQIIINFIKKATTAITRSERGIVCLLLDDTTATDSLYTYELLGQIDKADWEAGNYQVIRDAMMAGAPKVHVVRVGSDQSFADVKGIVDGLKFNWMACTNAASQSDIVDYVKDRNKASKGRKIKAVVYKAVKPDDIHIVNFTNEKVKRTADTEEITGNLYVGRIAGLLAAMPFTRSATYYELTDLESVVEPSDVDAAIDSGEFVIINDYGEPKVGRSVNSLQTLADGQTDDWKSIVTIEAIDLILEDIYTTFKNDYVGKYKNKYDNQCIFLSAVNRYFTELAKEEILDEAYDNHVEIDVEKQRDAWLNIGNKEAATWDELTVKQNTFKKQLFLSGNIKILDAMEDMVFDIEIA